MDEDLPFRTERLSIEYHAAPTPAATPAYDDPRMLVEQETSSFYELTPPSSPPTQSHVLLEGNFAGVGYERRGWYLNRGGFIYGYWEPINHFWEPGSPNPLLEEIRDASGLP